MKGLILKETRRQFLTKMGSVGIGLLVAACAKESTSTSAPSGDNTNQTPDAADRSGSGNNNGNDANICGQSIRTIYINPGHHHSTIQLSIEEATDAVSGDYILLGGSHSHAFRLTADDFLALQSGQSLQKEDLEEHGHIIEIKC